VTLEATECRGGRNVHEPIRDSSNDMLLTCELCSDSLTLLHQLETLSAVARNSTQSHSSTSQNPDQQLPNLSLDACLRNASRKRQTRMLSRDRPVHPATDEHDWNNRAGKPMHGLGSVCCSSSTPLRLTTCRSSSMTSL
jgi:hypothetical protein